MTPNYANQVSGFFEYARTHNVDIRNPAHATQAWNYYNETARAGGSLGPRPADGHIYQDGPWTMCVEDIISDISHGGSPLSRWLPTRAVNTREENVAHLSWVGPDGWDGSQDYMTQVNEGPEPAACDYGPSPNYQTCQYKIPYGKSSVTSQTVNLEDFGLLMECERSPIYRFRGPNAGLPIGNDKDFAAAQAQMFFEQRQNLFLVHGVYGMPYQADGLAQVISNGYVLDHIDGLGACDYSDPLVQDGSMLATPDDVLHVLRGMVRHIFARSRRMGLPISPNDIGIGIPSAMWSVLADRIPVGGLYPAPIALLTGGNTPQTAEQYRATLMNGGLGYGVMPIDGVNVPIVPLDEAGSNVNLNTQMTSDIFVLTRRAGGMTLLEQQYADYNRVAAARNIDGSNFEIFQGGIMRGGWLQENMACYKYFLEAYSRLVSYMQPLQGRITSVTLDALGPNLIESGTYTNAFYALNPTTGLLSPGLVS